MNIIKPTPPELINRRFIHLTIDTVFLLIPLCQIDKHSHIEILQKNTWVNFMSISFLVSKSRVIGSDNMLKFPYHHCGDDNTVRSN